MVPRKLSLEEAIYDSPKTQALLSIYEEDAQMLRQFAYKFHDYCEKIHTAQQALATASHGLAALIKKYGSMKFPLEKKNSCLVTTFPLLADYVEEIGSMHQEVARQISDSMLSPVSRFIKADLEELMQLQSLYALISDEHEQSTQRYAKLSTRCSEQARREAIDEVYHIRKKLHRTALHYFSSMNLVQQRRQLAFLEPLAGHLQAHMRLFSLANEFADRRDLDTLSGNARGLLLCLQREFDLERVGVATSVARLETAYPDAAFLPDDTEAGDLQQPPPPEKPVSGYLMQRCQPGVAGGGQARWERLHFALRNGGRLKIDARRCQQQSATISQLQRRQPAVRLRGGDEGGAATAAPAEMDDRRNVFIVTVPGARPLILQAESARQRNNWVAAIAEAASATEDVEDVDLDSSKDSQDEEEENRTSSSSDDDGEADAAAAGAPPLWLDSASERSSMALALGADSGGCVAGAAFCREFPARLIARCRAKPDAVVDAVLAAAAEASEEAMAATELLLMVSDLGVWLVEPASRLIRCRLPLSRARIWPAGKRLLSLTASTERPRRRVDCLALRLAASGESAENKLSDGRRGGTTTEAVLAAVSAAARSAELAHERETALLLSNIGLLPDASPPAPTPPPRQQSTVAAGEETAAAATKADDDQDQSDDEGEDGDFVESLA